MFPSDTKILIADDMMTIRKVIKKTLSQIGFVPGNITEAVNGKEAWEKLQSAEQPIQLIISDWNMPEMTGLDFLKTVRGSDKYKGLPFVLLTAEGEVEQVKEAIKQGVDAYIMKPFNAKTLQSKLGAVHKKYNK